MKVKKITFFICTLSSGGAEHQMCLLANFLVEKGYEVEIVTFGDELDHYPLSEKIHRIRIAERKPAWKKAIAIFFYFLRQKSDCIISFTQRANALMLPPMFLRPKINIVVGERNCTIGPSDLTEKLLFNILYRRANWIVPNSYTQASHIGLTKKSLNGKVVVITNYTDINEYKWKTPVKSEKVKIGIFCRYAPQKNYGRFLQAMSRLLTEGYSQFEVHWYGHAKQHGQANPYFEHFSQMVDELGLKNNVFPHDSIKNVAEMIPQYEALCIPSLYEGFSNSLSEYICCGRPVLASNVSDNSLMVHNGENGFLFNPESVEEITIAFEKLLSLSAEERNEMGLYSREIAESLFDKEHFVNAYVNLIEQEK